MSLYARVGAGNPVVAPGARDVALPAHRYNLEARDFLYFPWHCL
jgi:hypothetical protein